MNFLEKINISRKVLLARITKRKIPLAVSFNITYRCNLKCRYCRYREREVKELNTKEIFRLIEELSCSGIRCITFTGGEPFLREDLPEIINFCKSKKIYVSINSNGTLLKEMIGKIKGIGNIQISLDGPRHINDAIRGLGVHDKVIEAIEICKKENIKVNIVTVISKYNISHIPYVLEVADKHNIGVYFQPADKYGSCDSSKDIVSEIPDEIDYKACISFLINEKKNKNKVINSSLAGLKHLYNWPKPKKIFCLLSLIFCSIEPNGKIFICDNFPDYKKFLVSLDSQFKKSFDSLSLPHSCHQCWTASLVELNLSGSFNLSSIFEIIKRFKD